MATKGSKSDVASPAVKPPFASSANPVAAPVIKPAIPVAAAPAKPVATAPAIAAPAPKAIAPKPVPATPPFAAKPAPAPVVAPPAPVAAKPEAPVAVAPAPIAPVITPEAPSAVITAAITKKENVMEAINTATEKTQDQAQAMFSDANDRAKSAMEKSSKMIEDMNAFSKGNLEALAESTKIATKGAEDVARYTSDYAKAAVEKANATAKQFAAVKSPTELFKLQSDLAKDAMDQMMAETAKFTENYLKLLGEIAQPLSNRVAVAAEKMKIAA